MTDRNARPPEKINRSFSSHKARSVAQRKRDEDAAEVERLRLEQVRLREEFYRRWGGTEPPEAA